MKKIMLTLVCSVYGQVILANSGLPLETKTIRQFNKPLNYTIQVSFPQITPALSLSEKQFNANAKKIAMGNVIDFKKNLSHWDISHLPPALKAKGSSLTITYDLAILDPKQIISVRYHIHTYLVGSAHPSQLYSAINYDLIDNKPLSLAHLFQPHSNYLQKIARLTRQKITTQLNNKGANQQTAIFKEGLAPIAKNYAVWNLTPQGIQFTFNASQVAAYVWGPQEIIIPYQQLSKEAGDSTLSPCFKGQHCVVHTNN
jgi:hypothetical protein